MQNEQSSSPLTALILAGERQSTSELLEHTGASCKALIEIDKVPMLLRVINALDACDLVGDILLSGPHRAQLDTHPVIGQLADSGEIHWHEPGPTPSTSTHQILQTLAGDTRVLVTTTDLPFLSTDIIADFCSYSLAQDADVTVGLAPYELVRQSFPEMKKTVLRFKDGDYCACNLFAFTSEKGREMANTWRQVETQRKKPLRVIGMLGWRNVLAYRLGLLSLEQALSALSARMQLRIRAVILPYAHAAVDVDSVSDYVQVSEKMTETRGAA